MARSSILAISVAALLVSLPAWGQSGAQWTWTGTLTLGTDEFSRQAEGQERISVDQQELGLYLGLRGFILDPRIVPFTLGVRVGLTDTTGVTSRQDSNSLGLNLGFRLFPLNRYRWLVNLSHNRHDVADVQDQGLDLPAQSLGQSSTSTAFQAVLLRVRSGPLQGLSGRISHRELDFSEDARTLGDQTRDQQLLDYTTTTKRLLHHYRLEHQSESLSRFSTSDNFYLTASQSGDLKENLTWHLNSQGFVRSTDVEGRGSFDASTLRISSSVTRKRKRHDLQLTYNAGLAEAAGDLNQSHNLTVRSFLRPSKSLNVTPFVSYGFQSSDVRSLTNPQAGAAVSYIPRLRRLSVLFSTTATFGLVTEEEDGLREEADIFSFTFNGSVGYANRRGFSATLQGGYLTNERTRVGEVLEPLPDLGSEFLEIGFEDELQGGLQLRQGVGRVTLSLTAEYRDSMSAEFTRNEVRRVRETYSLQAAVPRVLLTFSQNVVEAESVSQTSEVETASVRISAMPFRHLRVEASYETDVRRLLLVPDSERERIAASLSYEFALLALRARAFQVTDSTFGFPDNTNEGLELTVSRSFGGRLPIFSTVRRRGVIR